MHKDIYASGFIFHPKTAQILLQKTTVSDQARWSLFGKKTQGKKTLEENFKDILEKFGIVAKSKDIFPIYSYSNELGEQNIFYAISRKLQKPIFKDTEFSWFTFKQINKLNISEQTKQDLIIGQRVIDSAKRKSEGLQTIG